MPITVHAIDALSAGQTDRWNELLLASPLKSAFLSHAFCKTVNAVRGNVFVLYLQEQDAEGFLPFQIRRGRTLLGHAEKVGGSMSDFFGVVGNLHNKYDPEELLRAAGLSALRFDHAVPILCPFSFSDAETRRGARLHVEDFAQFKKRLLDANKKFVKSVLYRERRLWEELGAIEFSWKAADGEALDRLIATKRAQYERTRVRDSLAEPWTQNLLRRLLVLPPTRTCEAVLSTLHAGGKWIASKMSLVCGDTLHSWFSVYDPQYRRYGPGHLVWFRVIEAGCAKGIRTFDFGEGESNYKAAYQGESYEVWKGVLRTNTLSGLSERLLNALEWRLGALVRRPKPQFTESPIVGGSAVHE